MLLLKIYRIFLVSQLLINYPIELSAFKNDYFLIKIQKWILSG